MKLTEHSLGKYIGPFFSYYLTAERGVSPHTLRSYSSTMTSYLDYLEKEKNIHTDKVTTAALCKNTVLDYLLWLEKSCGVSVSTRNQRLAAIHSLCRYLQHADVTHIDRWQEILSIKAKKTRPKPMSYLSVDGIKLLFEQIPTDTINGRRNLTMLALLYETGARVNELILLRPCDLHLDAPAYLVVRGKGNKNRSVPLQKKPVSMLKQYLTENHLDCAEMQSEPLFTNRVGERLTDAGVTYLLMKYVTLAHEKNPDIVPEKLTPHCLRHSKAMHLLQAGVKLVYIRDILGHVSVLTTEIYARADTKQKREALEEAYQDIIPVAERGKEPSWENNKSLKEWLKSLGRRSC